jgi:23S rRNA pseudouridine2605 synthase
MTNDGELANRLTHPRYGHQKEYRVLLARRPDDRQLDTWARGIVLEDGHHTAPAQVRFESTAGKGAWVRVIMGEGRKRQIREVGKQIGLPVVGSFVSALALCAWAASKLASGDSSQMQRSRN